jgi:hypothetical protein
MYKYLILLLLITTNSLFAQDRYTTTKTSCILQSNYPQKSLAQLKQILLINAKQEALTELYGQLIYSKTDVKDGKLISDVIRQKAIGSVRVSGNPKFYNGQDFGSICSDITVYITKKDLEKYSLKKIKLKQFCYTNPDSSIKNIKKEAKDKAYLALITQVKPSFNLSGSEGRRYIHNFKLKNDSFNFNTFSYCFDASGDIYPYELEFIGKPIIQKVQKKSENRCIKTGKTEVVKYDNGEYIGEFKNGKRHGCGRYEWKNGNYYDGSWKYGNREGYGRFDWSDGAYYVGNYKHSKMSGYGEEYFSDGGYYKGNYLNGNYNGQGELKYSNGDIYKGDFLNDKVNGYGEEYFSDGGYYKGNWKNGKFNGQGELKYSNGDIYKGDFLNDKANGYGEEYFSNGGYYKGNLKNGKFNGQGELKYSNGSIYKGDFLNDKRNGYGEKINADGSYYKGNWKNDTFDGKGELKYTDGDIYKGDFSNGKRTDSWLSWNLLVPMVTLFYFFLVIDWIKDWNEYEFTTMDKVKFTFVVMVFIVLTWISIELYIL